MALFRDNESFGSSDSSSTGRPGKMEASSRKVHPKGQDWEWQVLSSRDANGGVAHGEGQRGGEGGEREDRTGKASRQRGQQQVAAHAVTASSGSRLLGSSAAAAGGAEASKPVQMGSLKNSNATASAAGASDAPGNFQDTELGPLAQFLGLGKQQESRDKSS